MKFSMIKEISNSDKKGLNTTHQKCKLTDSKSDNSGNNTKKI